MFFNKTYHWGQARVIGGGRNLSVGPGPSDRFSVNTLALIADVQKRRINDQLVKIAQLFDDFSQPFVVCTCDVGGFAFQML